MIGQTLSYYRISEKISAGGMGVVYLAHLRAVLELRPRGEMMIWKGYDFVWWRRT